MQSSETARQPPRNLRWQGEGAPKVGIIASTQDIQALRARCDGDSSRVRPVITSGVFRNYAFFRRELVSVACQSGSRRNLQVVSREVEALFVVRVVPKYNERARTRKRGPLVNLFYFLSMFPKLNKFRLEQNVQVAAKEASNVQVKLEQYRGQLMRAAVELAKDWRTDRYLRRLEAMMIVADKDVSLVLTGTGDVLEPEAGIVGIGSGGN